MPHPQFDVYKSDGGAEVRLAKVIREDGWVEMEPGSDWMDVIDVSPGGPLSNPSGMAYRIDQDGLVHLRGAAMCDVDSWAAGDQSAPFVLPADAYPSKTQYIQVPILTTNGLGVQQMFTGLLMFGTDGSMAVCAGESNDFWAAATNEVQTLAITGADGGTFILSYMENPTDPIDYDPNDLAQVATDIIAALEALGDIGAGNVDATVNGDDIDIEFIGDMADQNIVLLGADGTDLDPTDPEVDPTITVTTTTPGKTPGTGSGLEDQLAGQVIIIGLSSGHYPLND